MENAASRFGQRLAHTEKKYRDQALKKLTQYLTKKTSWTDLELDKLWKALFYCMWMSDKRPVQEELSSNLALLIHKLPSVELSLAFVHSFFRTMHREWHGIDGLRLDKFYSLIRKFVHQSLVLLNNDEWDEQSTSTFVSTLSTEIISQLPNGLRMHFSDLYMTELWKAVGSTVDTDSFLLLLEPFFTLMGSEYDKIIFKRVRDLVFLPMLSEFKFGVQPEKSKKETDETGTDETDEEEEDKVFEHVDLAQVQHRIFTIASADDTAERNRTALYDLYGKFFQLTKVDSLKAIQEAAAKPPQTKKMSGKKRERTESAAPVDEKEDVNKAEKSPEKKKKQKSKKRKQSQVEAEEVEAEEAKKEEAKTLSPATTPEKKKQKKSTKKEMKQQEEEAKQGEETESTPSSSEKKKKKDKQKVKDVSPTPTNTPVKESAETESTKKKKTVSPAAVAEAVAAKSKAPAKNEKEVKVTEEKQSKSKAEFVTRSGKKFQRCATCRGYGKGLVPTGKALCGHCERTQKLNKKKKTKGADSSASKKRKSSAVDVSSISTESNVVQTLKKVTFGKNKALRHEVSVKRLKASAKNDSFSKDPPMSLKGVLKASSTSAVYEKKTKKTTISKTTSKGRMKAADFF